MLRLDCYAFILIYTPEWLVKQNNYSIYAFKCLTQHGRNDIICSSHFSGIPNVTIPNSNYSIGSGRHFVLECIIISTPDHHAVYWKKLYNGIVTNITSSSPGYDGTTDSSPSLNITQVSTADAGQYTCFAVNIVGIGSSQVTTLTVLGGMVTVSSRRCLKVVSVYKIMFA